MKLTADLVMLSPQFTNTLKEREIDLRENKLVVIENLGATLDQFDTIDLSDNEIRRLDGFPLLNRLKTLILNNNRISRVSSSLAQSLPNLSELILTNNNIVNLGDLRPLFELATLERLSLMRNPATAVQHYRHYVIHHLPHLKMLDFQKVKPKEREEAAELFAGAAGQELLDTIAKTTQGAKQAAVAAKMAQQQEAERNKKLAEHTARIQEAIKNASSLDEVAKLEAELRSGMLPGEAPANN
eukprot:TRINITY_DN10050_c0_g1_i1.p1 TRINITY_DN10050_c0_g1~~TRINITY_DN10050_c0_g1_i1.p1  ORF type:complete len:242 (+),score=61.81 TRINITY_DN10050_c0_g1_i1:562-1287(+)